MNRLQYYFKNVTFSKVYRKLNPFEQYIFIIQICLKIEFSTNPFSCINSPHRVHYYSLMTSIKHLVDERYHRLIKQKSSVVYKSTNIFDTPKEKQFPKHLLTSIKLLNVSQPLSNENNESKQEPGFETTDNNNHQQPESAVVVVVSVRNLSKVKKSKLIFHFFI